MSETIVLHNVQGITRKTGTDRHGNQWTEFRVDYLADQVDGQCAICGKAIASGWLCLDGGDEICDKHVRIHEPMQYDFTESEPVRTWTGGAFRLELHTDNQVHRCGKDILGYQFFHDQQLVFERKDFHCSPLHAIDSDATVAGILNFLSLRPGDTDAEYFENYTPKQMSFARNHGEDLACYIEELETSQAEQAEEE
jgi:hypothetical protein